MSALRRAAAALAAAGVIAGVLRLRGTAAAPSQSGGWRQLTGPELR